VSKTLKEVFPFEYVGGGYFREKGVPKGQSAKILHGMEAIKFVVEAMKEEKLEHGQAKSHQSA
jgi:hypothetical protein